MKTVDAVHFPAASPDLMRLYNGRRTMAEARLARGLSPFRESASNVILFPGGYRNAI